MSYGVGRRHGSDPAWLWPTVQLQFNPLPGNLHKTWEQPKKAKKKTNKQTKKQKKTKKNKQTKKQKKENNNNNNKKQWQEYTRCLYYWSSFGVIVMNKQGKHQDN